MRAAAGGGTDWAGRQGTNSLSRPHLAYWPRSGLPSANDQADSARGILRHDKGRGMPLSALTVAAGHDLSARRPPRWLTVGRHPFSTDRPVAEDANGEGGV